MLGSIKFGHHIKQSLSLLVGALFVLNLSGCATNPVSGNQNFVMMSEQQEIAMGRKYHPQIMKQYGEYKDPTLQQYVSSIGQRLAVVSHRKNLTYRFTVLDSPVINAFALPGGYIYITRGLMAYLNSEAELAAVLGHEIGHVTARHGVRQQSAGQAAGLLYGIGSILLPELRSRAAQQAFNLFGGALLSGYGRKHELESDRLGAEYLARSSYEPNAMLEVIGVLKDQSTFASAQAEARGQESTGYHGIFSSHPENDLRLQEVVGAAARLAKGGNIGRDRYLSKINGMVFGDSEAQGIRSGRNFYHGPMGFALSFPRDWQISNQPDKISATAPSGKAVIEMRAEDINLRISPREFIQQRLKISSLSKGRSLRSHGLKGYTGIAKGQGGKLARVSVIYLADKAYMFLGLTKDHNALSQFDGAFIDTAKSLHRIRAEEQKLAKAKRLEIVTVSNRDRYRQWAQSSRITNAPSAQLRLLNHDYPNGELTAGQKAKRVR